jgi:hypothetical protein
MVANEMFLDSVVKRESAVSIAKHLGYRPLSYRSAKAKLSFTINDPVDTPPTLTLPKFSIPKSKPLYFLFIGVISCFRTWFLVIQKKENCFTTPY